MKQAFRARLLLVLLLVSFPALADSEPPLVKAAFDAIQQATGARPKAVSIVQTGNGVVMEGVSFSLTNPREPDDVNETVIRQIVLAGVRGTEGGFRVERATFSGLSHRAAAFSMEVLQIDGLYAELGVDPPGSIGRSSDERIEIATLSLQDWKIEPGRFATGFLASMLFASRNAKIDWLTYASDGGGPLVFRDLFVEEVIKRSAGETWRFGVGAVELTAPWLEAIGGSAFAETGYSRLETRVNAETFRHFGHARGSMEIRAEDAFRLLIDYELDDLGPDAPLTPAISEILSSSPEARLVNARLAVVEGGMARRAMTLMARMTGAAPTAVAAALGQQAGSALQRAGYRRIAAEAASALQRFFTRFGSIALIAPENPLAAFAAMGTPGAPAALEAAGVRVEAR